MTLNTRSHNFSGIICYWNVRQDCMLIRLLMCLIMCILIGLGGCATPPPTPPPVAPPPPKYHVYTTSCLVQSLSDINEWYTGDKQHEEGLAKLSQISSPDCISQGTKILIPMALLKTTEEAPCPELYPHTVSCVGETLSIIAKWYTGDYRKWECLAKVNLHIENPALIRLDDLIHIPVYLMQTQEPMPQAYVDKCNERLFSTTNYTHTVIWEGESLAHIARWYTGDVQNWQRLFDLNPQLPNPKCIRQGTEILIPHELIADPEKREKRIPKPRPCVRR